MRGIYLYIYLLFSGAGSKLKGGGGRFINKVDKQKKGGCWYGYISLIKKKSVGGG